VAVLSCAVAASAKMENTAQTSAREYLNTVNLLKKQNSRTCARIQWPWFGRELPSLSDLLLVAGKHYAHNVTFGNIKFLE
jgi:hypothetical protein